MKSTERLLALIILPMLVLSACDVGFPTNFDWTKARFHIPIVYITGCVFAANDSSAIANASVKFFYIDANFVHNQLELAITDSSGRYWMMHSIPSEPSENLRDNDAFWYLEATADSFATFRITPADSNRIACISGTYTRDFYLQRVSP